MAHLWLAPVVKQMSDPLQCQNLEAHSKNLKNKRVDIPIQNSFTKLSLKNPTAQPFCGIILFLPLLHYFFPLLWIIYFGAGEKQPFQWSNAEQCQSDIKMTFDMSSWNVKGCISRNWKHILSGRTFTWALKSLLKQNKEVSSKHPSD